MTEGRSLPTQTDLSELRLKTCVEAWPDAHSGDYHPDCCRFPKSCSPHGRIEAVMVGNLTFDHLEERAVETEVPQDPGLEEKRTYGRSSIVGMTGGITNFSFCPDCGSLVMPLMEAEHDAFHEQLEAVQRLIIKHNDVINMQSKRLDQIAYYAKVPPL